MRVDIEVTCSTCGQKTYTNIAGAELVHVEGKRHRIASGPDRSAAEAPAMRVPTCLLRTEWPLVAGSESGYPFDELVESIRAEGIREPLTMKLDWSVIDGAHRLRAARLLGLSDVPVRVWTGREWVPDE
jgi:hypothetical protein